MTNWPIMSLRPCSPLGFKSGQVGADTQRWHSTRLLSRIGQVGADAQRRRPGPQNHKRKLSGCMRSSTCSPTYFCQHPAGTSTLSAHLQLHIVLSASCIVPHGHFAHFLPVSLTPNNHGYATMTAHLPHIVPHGLPTSANIVKLHIAPPTSC